MFFSRNSVDHLKLCAGTLRERKEIEIRPGLDAVKVLEDLSLLNSKSKNLNKSLKAFVADRVSEMIYSAAGGA